MALVRLERALEELEECTPGVMSDAERALADLRAIAERVLELAYMTNHSDIHMEMLDVYDALMLRPPT